MVEFTQREKILVHTMNIMNNPALKDVPSKQKTQALQAILLVCDYEWNENEMIDLMNAIGEETTYANKSTMGKLFKFKDVMKGLKKLDL